MKNKIFSLPMTFLIGFILLCLLNFFFRSLFNIQNLIILFFALPIFYLLRKRISMLIRKSEKMNSFYIFLFVGVLGIISMIMFQIELFDDPLVLSNRALKDVSDGTIKYNDLYSTRSMFYLTPIYHFLGTNIIIVKIINFIIYLLTGFLFYKILQLNFNKQFANIGTILFYSIPFYLLSINIPHYDLISAFYQFITLLLLTILIRETKTHSINSPIIILLTFLLGISYILLFYTRGLSMAFHIAVGVFTMILLLNGNIKFKYKIKLILTVAIFPLLVYNIANIAFKQSAFSDNTPIPARKTSNLLFSANDTQFDGTNTHWDKYWVYFPEIPKNLQTLYGIKKLNSEIYYNWNKYINLISKKSQTLYQINGMNYWILRDYKFYKNEISLIIVIFIFILQMVIAVFAILGFSIYIRNKNNSNIFLLFTIAFVFTNSFFSLLSHTEPRYSLIIVFGLIIFAVMGLVEYANDGLQTGKRIKALLKPITLTVLLLLVGFPVYRYFVAKEYKFEQLKPNSLDKAIGGINLSAFQKSVYWDDSIIRLKKPDEANSLSFFLRIDKNNLNNMKIIISDDSQNEVIKINKENLTELKTNPGIALGFFDIEINNFKSSEIRMDFSGLNLAKPVILEYVSFN